jgi:hypothetical protein
MVFCLSSFLRQSLDLDSFSPGGAAVNSQGRKPLEDAVKISKAL